MICQTPHKPTSHLMCQTLSLIQTQLILSQNINSKLDHGATTVSPTLIIQAIVVIMVWLWIHNQSHKYFNVSKGHLLLDPLTKLPIHPRFRALWQYNVLMTGEPMTCFNYCLVTVDEMKGYTPGYA